MNLKIIKRNFECDWVVLLLILSFFAGCAGLTITRANKLESMARAGGYMLGYIVGSKADKDLESRVAVYYETIQKGGLTVDMVNTGLLFLSESIDVNPGLVSELTHIMGEFGARFDANGNVIDLRQIPVSYLDRGAAGYHNGLIAAKWDMENN